jgi:hypothetical protein
LVLTNVRERLSVGKVAKQALIWRDSIWRIWRRYLHKMSNVCSFGDRRRASENMICDIRLPAENRFFRSGRRFRGKNCRE